MGGRDVAFGKKATPWQIAEELEKSEGVLAHGIVTRADAVVVVDERAAARNIHVAKRG